MNASGIVNAAQVMQRLAEELPAELRDHLFVVGSLAAAYHHVEERVVRTKDADLVIHPAKDVVSAARIAERLLGSEWRRKDDCYASAAAEPVGELRAIRLYPPDHDAYFIELLNVPAGDQAAAKSWVPVELADGWYGLPTFEYLALAAVGRQTSEFGLDYAAPCMMALANLLSHPILGVVRMSTPIGGRSILRSAKDLGRVLALAHLAGRRETETWPSTWRDALRQCFPDTWAARATRTGNGLRELLVDHDAFEQAWFSCDYGLLSGRDVAMDQLQATAKRLLMDAIEPLEASAREPHVEGP